MSTLTAFTADEKRRMRADLIRDVDLINSGWRPDDKFLEEKTVLLDDWHVHKREDGTSFIVGQCWAHPDLPRGWIETSQIAWAHWEGGVGVARSQHYWYLLGNYDQYGFQPALVHIEGWRR